MSLRPPIDLFQRIVPWCVILYGIYGLLFRTRGIQWGLPMTFWYIMGITMGVLVLIMNWLADKDAPHDR